MNFRYKLSINEIARHTSLSRNIVKKWLRMPDGTQPGEQRRLMSNKLTLYEYQLKKPLIIDSHHPSKRGRYIALR
jgi:hypothetical protein